MREELLEKLECFNIPEFKFNEELHRYTLDGDEFISATTYIGQFKEPFDKEYWSNIKSVEETERTGEYVSASDIIDRWQSLNDHANKIGNFTHDWIEDYFNRIWREIPSDAELLHRITKFNKIYSTKLHKLTPLKFEVRMFSRKYKIAGMADALFIYKGKIFILDWKTNKEFTDDNHYKGKYQKLRYPFNDHYANHLNEYSIQLSLYGLILEEWGFEIGGAYIVYIGPGEEDAKIMPVIDMRNELKISLENNIKYDK